MTTVVPPFPQIEIVLRELFRRELVPDSPAQVGRDILGAPPGPWYLRVEKIGGATDRFGGDLVVDIEVFMSGYLAADSLAGDIEGILLGYPYVVEVDGQNVVIDSVSQNAAPHEIFWEDETVTRILATYVITMRR